MMGSRKLLFSFIIIKNALLKKKLAVNVPMQDVDIELLEIFRSAGLITNFYKITGDRLKIILNYPLGKPA